MCSVKPLNKRRGWTSILHAGFDETIDDDGLSLHGVNATEHGLFIMLEADRDDGSRKWFPSLLLVEGVHLGGDGIGGDVVIAVEGNGWRLGCEGGGGV